MSQQDSYQRQLQLLDHMRSQLNSLHGHVEGARNNYNKQIKWLDSNGFMAEYTDRLDVKYQRFSRLIDELNKCISHSIQVIDRHEGHVEELRNDGGRE
ncbi:hypothetical protein [Chitinilyticum aquatile]|uniref:hypothetical protein n=1 Tax=Chitinilyticum aquatile TaxID=362520 RepID=UPI000490737F|nr:hypothetical protein [Chitinilyticum aquatile]